MKKRRKKKSDFQKIIVKLQKRAIKSHKKLAAQFPHVVKKLDELGLDLSELRRHSAKMLTAAAIAGGMLAASPLLQHTTTTLGEERQLSPDELQKKTLAELGLVLPNKVGPLAPAVEDQIHDILLRSLSINAVGQLEGNHLNTTFGYIGAEQHLPRYPGDTIGQHDELLKEGMTPGRGAWGYFASSKAAFTPEDSLREKYYVAVQTLYLPNWKKDLRYLRDWYKYRKVLVVNPKNGRAVVADIADAGPAAWTGKHFGGSPEVMQELQLNTGKQKGAVILFFIDDRNNTIALGPVRPSEGTFIAKR